MTPVQLAPRDEGCIELRFVELPRRMPTMLFLPLLFLLQAVPSESEAETLLQWNYRCTSNGSHCWMEKFVDFTGPQKTEQGGVAVAYDRANDEPMYVTVFVPPNVERKPGVTVHFVDSVPDGTSWKLEAAPTGTMNLPITVCNAQFCEARIHPQIDNGDGTSTNFFAELKVRHFLWVLFLRNGKPERFMVPTSGMAEALQAIDSMPSPWRRAASEARDTPTTDGPRHRP